MLLALDIGNTNIVIGLFDKDNLINQWRLETDLEKSADDYAVDMVESFLTNKIDCLKITGVIISSVVPIVSGRIEEAVKKFTSESTANNIMFIGDDNVKFDIKIEVNDKSEVGHDRLVNSIYAYNKYGGGLTIIDFGTATTFDIVGKKGEYLGGVISPGVKLSLKALYDLTAQLPMITIKKQSNVIGKSTTQAMNSGIYFGYSCLIEGMIDKINNELGYKNKVIITGGLANIFKHALTDKIDHHEPDLTLLGLKKIYDDNQ